LPSEQSGPQAPGTSGRTSPQTTVEDTGQVLTEVQRYALSLLFGRVFGDRRSFELGDDDPLPVGREVDEEQGIRLDDVRASRRHAEIHWSELHRRHWVRDLRSRNGIYVNGTRVAREVLKSGDVLRVGDTVFRYGPAPAEGLLVRIEPPLVGRSSSLAATLDAAVRVAASDAPVLVLGETGTGKEHVARTIHGASGRTGPVVPVNCAALASHLVESELFGHEKGAFTGADAARPGLFRAAQAGTLFLDEVGELPADIQAKLLRAVDTGSIRPVGAVAETPVDVRVVAATNRELAGEVRSGGFRADLFARLAELVVAIDPLRERPEDLEPLWRHFVVELGHGTTLEMSGAVCEALALHRWPFNVRELRQLVRSALLRRPRGGTLSLEDLPPPMRPTSPAASRKSAEPSSAPALVAPGEVPTKQQLRQLVEEFHGSVKDIASFLGKDRKQIYRWLRKSNIDPDAYRIREE
jgi:transcriptional regulator with AAA-type ATPase domain